MSAFDFQSLSRFEGPSKRTKRPVEIACFSYDEDHEFHIDDRSLRYYYNPELGADLTKGFENFRQWDDSKDEHLDSLLATIMDLEKKQDHKCAVNFVTWRGMMTKILTAPYDSFNSFSMRATLFQDTIFIEEDHSAKMAEKAASTARQNQGRNRPRGGIPPEVMQYTGYKFETLATISDTWQNTSRAEIEGRDDQQVSNYAQYCSVVESGIGEHSMIIGGEVDAVWDEKPKQQGIPINWVELKTTASPLQDERSAITFERKLNRFWAQSFLLGVPKVIVGFRDNSGRLSDIEELDVMKLPGTVKRMHNTWNGNVCVNFADEFLSFLRNTIRSEGTWKIKRDARSSLITVTKEQESGTDTILTTEFKEWRQSLLADQIAQMLG